LGGQSGQLTVRISRVDVPAVRTCWSGGVDNIYWGVPITDLPRRAKSAQIMTNGEYLQSRHEPLPRSGGAFFPSIRSPSADPSRKRCVCLRSSVCVEAIPDDRTSGAAVGHLYNSAGEHVRGGESIGRGYQ
jgi:hypothetical protein